ncbi:transposase, partial [Tannerella forsythia]
DNAKQVARFIGICPTYQQSGTSVHIKGGINRNRDENLRSLLYVASWSALRANTTCKECYARLKANGKPSKVALMAVANKLIRQAFAVIKSSSPYVDGFVSAYQTK